MVVYRAAGERYEVIDFGMRSPTSLRVSDYPLSGAGISSDLFPWAHVQDDRNVHGPLSLAIPGYGGRHAHAHGEVCPAALAGIARARVGALAEQGLG